MSKSTGNFGRHNSSWPAIRLTDVLTLDLDRVPVDPSQRYPMVGVLSFERGLFDREPIENGKTSYRIFYRLRENHIVMSQLFGWEGALALSSERFAGKYVSPNFPTFVCDERKIDRTFLGWLMRRRVFWEELGKRSSGMGDRRRTLNPDALLRCEISLPPLPEQRRIVARIEKLAAQINEARTLRQQAAEEADAFVTSLHVTSAGNRTKKLGEILRLEEDSVVVEALGSYPQVGIKSFGGGLFSKSAVAGTETTYRTFNRLYPGAVVLSQVKGWEGAVAVCPSELGGWFASPEYRTFRCVPSEARPKYLAAIVRTQWFWSNLASATRGVSARRERTRPEQFLDIELPDAEYRTTETRRAHFIESGCSQTPPIRNRHRTRRPPPIHSRQSFQRRIVNRSVSETARILTTSRDRLIRG